MRELSTVEIEATSGGAFNVAIGAAIGGIGYLAFNGITGQDITLAGFASSVVMGGVTSGYSALGQGLKGAAAVANNVHSAAIGTLAGGATHGAVSGVSGGGGGVGSGGGGGGGKEDEDGS